MVGQPDRPTLNNIGGHLPPVALAQNKRLQANLDVFNVMNSSYVLGQSNTFGSTWQKPSQTMDGLMFQLSANLSF